MELICEIYDLYNAFVSWVKRCGTVKKSYGANELFHHKLSQIISDLINKLDPHDERIEMAHKLFGKYEKIKNALPQHFEFGKKDSEVANVTESKSQMLYNKFESTKESITSNSLVIQQTKEEFDNFCEMLLRKLTKSSKSSLINRRFIGKFIEYIGHCVYSTEVSNHVIKYILTALIVVIEKSGEGLDSDEKNEKRQMQVIKLLDKLMLTKTILTLLYSEELEQLNSIMPLLFRLANRMLIGAIPEIQNQFFNEFENNSKSERFFERMHSIISRNIFVYHNHPDKFAIDFDAPSKKIYGKIDSQSEILKFVKIGRASCRERVYDRV